MALKTITGKWNGVIIYGPKYRQFAGKELYFEADFEQTKDSFHGIAKDTGGTGVNPDKATISGSLTPNSITFIKRYDSLHYQDNDQIIIDKTRPGYDIYYSGNYDEGEGVFKGTWEYRIEYWLFGLIPRRYVGGGTWTMSRK
jgi:hypothetical protein